MTRRSIPDYLPDGFKQRLADHDRRIADLYRRIEYVVAAPSRTSGSTITGAQVRRTGSDQPTADGAWTTITFDTESYDTDHFFTMSTPDRFTIPHTGLYLVSFASNFGLNSTGVRGIRIYLNDTTAVVTDQRPAVDAAYWNLLGVSQIAQFNAGDEIKAQQYQNTGGTVDAEVGTGPGTADQQPRFSIARFA